MLKPGGYAVWTSPAGVRERDSFTCAHCNSIVLVEPAPAPPPGGWCRMEMKPVCGPCADKGRCTPWEKQLERAEARARTRKSLGL